MQKTIKDEIQASLDIKKEVLEKLVPSIEQAASLLIAALKSGKKILLCGNGGSAADSQHFAAELVSRYKKERRSLPAIALTVDTSILTAIGNDYSFDRVFARQVEGLGEKGDVLIGISTSGKSKNVLEAVKTASGKGLKTLGLLGCGGGTIASACDASIIIPSSDTPRIQEAHILVIHILCTLIEEEFSK